MGGLDGTGFWEGFSLLVEIGAFWGKVVILCGVLVVRLWCFVW
jgi:hypothetical protein